MAEIYGELNYHNLFQKEARRRALAYIDGAKNLMKVADVSPPVQRYYAELLANAHSTVASWILGDPVSCDEYLQLNKRIEIKTDGTIMYKDVDD